MLKLSLIIPCLNVKQYVRECMDSAVNQTLEDMEIIVVDGGSSDGTIEIINEFKQCDCRITIIHSDIKSYGYQVNLGLKHASAEYVAVLESDDFVDLNMYEILCKAADIYNVEVVKADYDRFITLSNGYREYTRIKMWKNAEENYNRVLNPRDYLEIFYTDYFLWKGIYRRSFIETNNILFHETPGAAFQDIGFLQQVMAAANRVVYIRESLYRYRTDRDESSMYSPRVLKYGYDEFSWLLNMHYRKEKKLYLNGVCSHMLHALCGELRAALKATKYDIENEYIKNYYEPYKDLIFDCLQKCDIQFDDLCGNEFEMIEAICNNVEVFIENERTLDLLASSKLSNLLENMKKNDEVIIFGCGIRGRNMIMKLDQKCVIKAITDNNPSKWGDTCMNYPILSPKDCVLTYPNANYIIAVKGYENEIKNQLEQMGISPIEYEL